MSSCFHNRKKEKSASYLYCYLYFFFILPLLSYLVYVFSSDFPIIFSFSFFLKSQSTHAPSQQCRCRLFSGRFFVTHYVLSCETHVDTEFDCRYLNFVFFNVSGLVSDTVFQTTSWLGGSVSSDLKFIKKDNSFRQYINWLFDSDYSDTRWLVVK